MKQYFRTIGSIVAISAMIVMAASCAKEELSKEEQQNIQGVERTINASATLPQPTEKAYLDVNDGRKVKWELSDVINVNGSPLALTNLYADPTKARFEGTTYAITSGSEEVYWFVYPTILAGTASGSTIPSTFTANRLTVTLPDVQTFDLSQTKILEGGTYMAAKASVPAGQTNLVFTMKNLCAVMKIHLSATGVSNTNVERLVFSSNSRLNGSFYFDGSKVTATSSSTCNRLTVNLTDGTHSYIDISSGVDVYVVLPPIKNSNLSMTAYNTDGYEVTKTASSATLASNFIYTNTCNITAFSPADYSISVNASGKKVVFAPGNLQWSATNGGTTATTHAVAGGGTAAGTWRFAEHQWDYVGDATYGTVYGVGGDPTVKCNHAYISSTYQGWIDLFGWATSGYHDATDPDNTNYMPYTTTGNSKYGPSDAMTDLDLVGTSANYDWGVYNEIYNPKTGTTDPAGTWRSLTTNEWKYLLTQRTGCPGARFAKAQVNGVNGLIIIPDNWVNPYHLNNINARGAEFTANTITSSDWDILESVGCAFLPISGFRQYAEVTGIGNGFYWTATHSSGGYAVYMKFQPNYVYESAGTPRRLGMSIRLAKDVH